MSLHEHAVGHLQFKKVLLIESILASRGMVIQMNKPELRTLRKLTYVPFFVGFASVLLAFFYIYFHPTYNNSIGGLVILLLSRFALVMYLSDFIKPYSLHPAFWYLSTLFLGGWAMIALNIKMVFAHMKSNDQMHDPITNAGLDSIFHHEEKRNYTHCPTCENDLNGQKKCKDCDLEFD